MNILVNPYISFRGAGLFYSEKEWTHPKRVEKTYEIIYVTEGVVHMRENGADTDAGQGQIMLLEPDTLHEGYRESRRVGFYWLHFSLSGENLPFKKRFFERFDSAYLFRELLHCNNLPSSSEHTVNAILIRILCELCDLSDRKDGKEDGKASVIYEWIRANSGAALTAANVAARFQCSTDHATRLLTKYCGKGIKGVNDMFVIKRAKELLCNTNKYIKEIAFELGFCSDNAFIAFFKYHEGIYPEKYRNRFFKTHMNSK